MIGTCWEWRTKRIRAVAAAVLEELFWQKKKKMLHLRFVWCLSKQDEYTTIRGLKPHYLHPFPHLTAYLKTSSNPGQRLFLIVIFCQVEGENLCLAPTPCLYVGHNCAFIKRCIKAELYFAWSRKHRQDGLAIRLLGLGPLEGCLQDSLPLPFWRQDSFLRDESIVGFGVGVTLFIYLKSTQYSLLNTLKLSCSCVLHILARDRILHSEFHGVEWVS